MSPQVDPVQIHGLKRLRHEYFERNPGGDFKAFLKRWDGLREAMHGDRGPVRFYGLTFGHVERSQANRFRETAGVSEDDVATDALPASIPADEGGRLDLLKRAGLADAGCASLREALLDLQLPFMFAGREQWIRNLASAGEVEVEPWLQNVSMVNPANDESALRLLLGRAQEAVAEGRSLAADVSSWRELVPSWAPAVRDELAAQGIPFSVELLASPEINLHDPSKPLFPAGSQPASLLALGVLQDGENAFLASLSAEELMTQIWPLAYRYHHRPPGAPVPEGFEAGLTFGSPVLRPDGTYVRSPMMETEAYKRWAALGFPGEPTQNGVLEGSNGATYNPLLGTGSPGGGFGVTGRAVTGGGGLVAGLGVIGAAAFLDDPSVYFAGPREAYNPAYLDEATKSRLLALMGVEQPAAPA